MTAAREVAERWLAAEPDDDIREELQALLDGPDDVLTERFGGHLTFGTAGLRAAIGAGPLRMNRMVVRQAARGLTDYLLAEEPDAAGFLYGFTSGADLAECGRLGSVAAAEVISHVGARPLVRLRRLA